MRAEVGHGPIERFLYWAGDLVGKDTAVPIRLSATLENEAIATVENEATQTDWMGDLCGGLGSDSATGCGRCSAAPGRAGLGHRQVDCRAGVGV